MRQTVSICGVNITDESFEEALKTVSTLLEERKPRTLFFVNANTLNLAAASSAYRDALNSADVVFGDGTGVRWAARSRGMMLQANLNGTDTIPSFLRTHPGLRVYLLGGDAKLISAAAANFTKLFPACRLVGWHHGYVDAASTGALLTEISRAKPDILLVGMGNPIQENWIVRHRSALTVPLMVGVGGLFAYWAGTLERAPIVMRRLGVEWMYILWQQPHKAKRYLVGNALFLYRIAIGFEPLTVPRARSLARRWVR